MTNKPKVLILYNKLFDYRIPIWNIMAKDYDLTVAFCEGNDANNCEFKTLRLKEPRRIGPFFFHHENIYKLACKFNYVIALGNIKWPKYATLAFRKRPFKYAIWSLGVSASYAKGYDKVTRWDWIRDIFYKAADACVFYTDYVVRKNLNRGFDPAKMFVAQNTVKVLDLKDNVTKDSILFIGSLYKEKGIQILLDSYKNLRNNTNQKLPLLNIIGGGKEYKSIEDWIKQNNMSDTIQLLGPIYDKELKRDYFQKAYACISPKQAGLAVLESLGYGVPFITRDNAITGGEIFNIVDNVNGILVKKDYDFETIISDIAINPSKYIEMGSNARQYYVTNRTPEIMAQGLLDTIHYLQNIP